ncbi:MAG: hypothetical protein QW201_01405 [Thermoproteota archaeon]
MARNNEERHDLGVGGGVRSGRRERREVPEQKVEEHDKGVLDHASGQDLHEWWGFFV